MRLEGRIAVVTGGASGIGRAAAARFAAEGAEVFVTDVAADAGRAVAEEIGGRFVLLDVADPDAWATFGAECGPIDLLALNAGVFLGASDLADIAVADYLRLIGINQHGVFFGLRALLPNLEAAGGGDVLVTASMAAVIPLPNDLLYSMSKHAVAGLVRSSARDLERRGIRINATCPGTVDTGFIAAAGRERLEARGIAVMDPADVADGMMEILASGESGRCWIHPPGGVPTPFEFASP